MNSTETGKWIISQDEEYWSNPEEYESKEKAIEEGKKYYCGENFYVGQSVKVEFARNDTSLDEKAIEQLEESLSENVGEVSEQWVNGITRDQEVELGNMLSDTVLLWIKVNNLFPRCYMVDDIEKIELESEEQ